MENDFCNFLINIGLIDLKTSKNLKEINQEITKAKQEFNFSDCFFISLMHYFNNLTISQKKYICFNLPIKFLLNKDIDKKKKLSSIILKKHLKEKLIKFKYLCIWIRYTKIKRKTITKHPSGCSLISRRISFDEFLKRKKNTPYKLNDKSSDIKNNEDNNISNSNNSIKAITSSKIKNIKIRKYNSFNKSRLYDYYSNKANDIIKNKDMITTTDKKELLQLSECTFKPSINTTNNSFRKSKIKNDFQSTFDKLYKDGEKYRIKKNLKALEREHIINKELTFKPILCQTPKMISSIKYDKFEIRQQKFIENKVKNAKKIKKDEDTNTERNCSFSPNINSNIDFSTTSFNNNNITNEENKNINTNNNNNNCDSYYSISTVKTIPAHVRLYDDSKRRNSSYIQKEMEIKNLIDEMASRTSKRFCQINYSKLDDLYENKGKKICLEKTRKKVEKEEGITFKPELNLNNKYANRIFSNFYERNKNIKKNKIYEDYKNYKTEDRKENKFTENEKKEIVKNIVARLYNESISRNLTNTNKNDCIKYIKSNHLSEFNTAPSQKHNYENITNSKIN